MSIFFPNNAGTVRFNAGSATINGTGTLFKGYRAGSTISIPGIGSMQLAADPTSDTVATGSVVWGGATTPFQAFEYHARNEEGVFSDTFVQLLNSMRSGNLPALAALDGTGGDKGVVLTGAGTADTFALTAKARALLALADSAGMRAEIEALAMGDFAADIQALLGAPDADAARGSLGANDASNLIAGILPDDRLPTRLGAVGKAIPSGDYNLALEFGAYSGPGPAAINGPGGNLNYGPVLVLRGTSPYILQVAGFGAGSFRPSLKIRGSNDGGGTFSDWLQTEPVFGSNGNGSFVQFGDGTQICWATITVAIDADTYSMLGTTRIWPAAFVAAPSVTCGGGTYSNKIGSAFFETWDASSYVVRPVNFDLVSPGQNGAGTMVIPITAVGRYI